MASDKRQACTKSLGDWCMQSFGACMPSPCIDSCLPSQATVSRMLNSLAPCLPRLPCTVDVEVVIMGRATVQWVCPIAILLGHFLGHVAPNVDELIRLAERNEWKRALEIACGRAFCITNSKRMQKRWECTAGIEKGTSLFSLVLPIELPVKMYPATWLTLRTPPQPCLN